MPSPPKKYMYNLIYSDGSYQTFELTRSELDDACTVLETGEKRGIRTTFGFIVLSDVRTIVEYKEPEEQSEQESQLATGIPGGDLQVAAYLRSLEQQAEDALYEGRMLY